jgi:hypothetical protein
MVSFIITAAVLGVIGVASAFAGRKIVNSVPAKYAKYSRVVSAIAAPAVAFIVLALFCTVTSPPQSNLNVTNVDWTTRSTGVIGATSDAILVRTTGANVNAGFLYSTAVLSGQEYVSVLGSPWIANSTPVLFTALVYAFLAAMAALLAVAASYALTAYEQFTAPKAAA